MKKKELYIFNEISRAAVYGIGSYIDQLIKALKDTEWKINIVLLYAQGNEIEITEKNRYRQINIPSPFEKENSNLEQYYLKIIPYILRIVISEDSETEYIFHMNFMINSYLVKRLKKYFTCKIISAFHYTDWSLVLSGDYSRLEAIIKKSKREVKTDLEKAILKRFKEDLKIINRVDCIIFVAQYTLKTYCMAGNIHAKKIAVIHNALEDSYVPLLNEEKLLLRKKYLLEERVKIILFAGRLDEIKGVTFLIQAFKMVLTTNPDTCLFIAGDGDFDLLLKESADCWTKIYFTGLIEKKKIFELYNIADIGVVCSLHEEFGLVAIEMLMHALPVIVTQTGGLDEIVEDGISGLKVPIRTIQGNRQVDVKQLAEKIRFLLDNPVNAQELGENGRKRFLEKFELSIFKDKMLNLYENL
ncbi:MAG: TIGR04157 family glycosyltransferase [Candidatus Azobacteroides sp.]|nr:TIGR04157 family glycosyltransferase [Candidatus Azobacteroides sp.]